MATIREIALKAGVSAATVSRVLNNDLGLSVSDAKRQKILEIAELLDYQTPRKRTSAETQKIRLALVHWYSMKQELEDPYYISIRLGIEKLSYEKGVELVKIFDPSHFDFTKLEPVSGFIAIGKFSDALILKMKEHSEHIVFVDSAPDDDLYDSVCIDFEQAVTKALDYLISQGHTKIGYIGGREGIAGSNQILGEKREQSFRVYLSKLGIYHPSDVHVGRFLSESGYQLMKKAIQSGSSATAYFVASDSMAIGVLRAVSEAGLKVPDDISVVSINDIAQSRYTIPPLTTIRIHKEEMGEIALSLMLERLQKPDDVRKRITVSTKLIIRDSVKSY